MKTHLDFDAEVIYIPVSKWSTSATRYVAVLFYWHKSRDTVRPRGR